MRQIEYSQSVRLISPEEHVLNELAAAVDHVCERQQQPGHETLQGDQGNERRQVDGRDARHDASDTCDDRVGHVQYELRNGVVEVGPDALQYESQDKRDEVQIRERLEQEKQRILHDRS